MRLTGAGRALWVLALFAGCGGGSAGPPGSGGGSCVAKASCGGDVVGTWTITSQCADVGLADVCAGAKLNPAGLTVTGMVTYNSDLTYVLTTHTTGMQKLTFPKACLTGSGTTSCAEFASTKITENLYSGVTGTVCSSLTGACDCTVDVDTQPTTESGTYALSGNVIMHTPMNGEPYGSNYCVAGTQLDATSIQANVVSSTLFTRQ